MLPPNPVLLPLPPNLPSARMLADFFVGEDDRLPVRFLGEVVCVAQRWVCFHDAAEVTGPSREEAHAR